MVGLGGLEPPTSPLSGARSSHLSYRPNQLWQRLFLLYRTRQILAIPLRPCVFFSPSWHDDRVPERFHITITPLSRRIHWIQVLTLVWMSFEAGISLLAAWRAHSPGLFAFGGDSLIELISAALVLWRFTVSSSSEERVEQWATRLAGMLLLLLAAYVSAISVLALLGYQEPKPSLSGICILVAAAAVMPWLAREKRKLSSATGSAALRADAAQSSMCGYLALIAVAGLLVNLFWNIGRADSIAALATIPIILRESRESLRGKSCVCG